MQSQNPQLQPCCHVSFSRTWTPNCFSQTFPVCLLPPQTEEKPAATMAAVQKLEGSSHPRKRWKNIFGPSFSCHCQFQVYELDSKIGRIMVAQILKMSQSNKNLNCQIIQGELSSVPIFNCSPRLLWQVPQSELDESEGECFTKSAQN